MKKILSILAVSFAAALILSGCSSLLSVLGRPEATPAPTAAPTPAPTPTAEPTPEPTPDPVAELIGRTWIAYHDTTGIEKFVFELNFRADGTMDYMAGWYLSEIAFFGEGSYTLEGDELVYTVRDGETELSGSVKFTLENDLLTLSLGSGDALTYLLETESIPFIVKGSANDVPPSFE